jgi:hypothetical protein
MTAFMPSLRIPNKAIEQNTHRCQCHCSSTRGQVNLGHDELIDNKQEIVERQTNKAKAAPKQEAVPALRV